MVKFTWLTTSITCLIKFSVNSYDLDLFENDQIVISDFDERSNYSFVVLDSQLNGLDDDGYESSGLSEEFSIQSRMDFEGSGIDNDFKGILVRGILALRLIVKTCTKEDQKDSIILCEIFDLRMTSG